MCLLLLIIPLCCAETLFYLPTSINLSIAMDHAKIDRCLSEYLNLTAMYIFGTLATSQGMGLLGACFKSIRTACALLDKMFPALPDADIPFGALNFGLCILSHCRMCQL